MNMLAILKSLNGEFVVYFEDGVDGSLVVLVTKPNAKDSVLGGKCADIIADLRLTGDFSALSKIVAKLSKHEIQ